MGIAGIEPSQSTYKFSLTRAIPNQGAARLEEGDVAEGLVGVLDLHDDDAGAPAEGGEAEEDLPLEALDVDDEQLEARRHAGGEEEVVQRALRRADGLARVVAGAPVQAGVHLQPAPRRARSAKALREVGYALWIGQRALPAARRMPSCAMLC
jgi:hypothetical protein